MDLTIPEFRHTASLTLKKQEDFIEGLGCAIIDNKLINFPKNKIKGSGYFIELSSDVSVLIVDLVLKEPMCLTRMPSEEDFWIVYYDMSDNLNKHFIDSIKHKTGYKSKLGFAIIDSRLQSSYVSSVGERVYSLRLYIRKTFIKNYFQSAVIEKDFKNIFDNKKREMFYYGHIDSRSKVELHNLKCHNMSDSNYEFLLKSTAFKLFGYFLERLKLDISSKGLFLEKDLKAIMKTHEYLLSDLCAPFPGVRNLSQIANMSISKYRSLYENVFGMSALSFFKKEKLALAKKLLKSGEFKTISDVAFELGYQKTAHFSRLYKKHYGDMPSSIFRSKT